MKLELLTNATVVDDAIRFVSGNKRPGIEKEKVTEEEENKATVVSTGNCVF